MLRNFCAIVMLCMLIYTGIRIVLSSASAGERKEWKMKLMEWVQALILLTCVHLIMIGIFYICEVIMDALKSDSNMSISRQLRAGAYDSWSLGEQLILLTMYTYTTWLTIAFAIAYFKRLMWVVILIVVAPIVSMLYCFGREGKGIFGRWFREFTLAVLIQPYHYIVYYVLIAIPVRLAGYAGEMPEFSFSGTLFIYIYCLIAMSMIKPFEKYLRELFGMNGKVANMASYESGKQTIVAALKTAAKVVMTVGTAGAGGAAMAAAKGASALGAAKGGSAVAKGIGAMNKGMDPAGGGMGEGGLGSGMDALESGMDTLGSGMDALGTSSSTTGEWASTSYELPPAESSSTADSSSYAFSTAESDSTSTSSSIAESDSTATSSSDNIGDGSYKDNLRVTLVGVENGALSDAFENNRASIEEQHQQENTTYEPRNTQTPMTVNSIEGKESPVHKVGDFLKGALTDLTYGRIPGMSAENQEKAMDLYGAFSELRDSMAVPGTMGKEWQGTVKFFKEGAENKVKTELSSFVNNESNIQAVMDSRGLLEKYKEMNKDRYGYVNEKKAEADAKAEAKSILEKGEPYIKKGITDVGTIDRLLQRQKESGGTPEMAIKAEIASQNAAVRVENFNNNTSQVQATVNAMAKITGTKESQDVVKQKVEPYVANGVNNPEILARLSQLEGKIAQNANTKMSPKAVINADKMIETALKKGMKEIKVGNISTSKTNSQAMDNLMKELNAELSNRRNSVQKTISANNSSSNKSKKTKK